MNALPMIDPATITLTKTSYKAFPTIFITQKTGELPKVRVSEVRREQENGVFVREIPSKVYSIYWPAESETFPLVNPTTMDQILDENGNSIPTYSGTTDQLMLTVLSYCVYLSKK